MHNVVNPAFVLITAECPQYDRDENETRSCEMASALRNAGMAYKWVVGNYEGREEDAFLVIVSNDTDLKFMERLRSQFEQECFLYVDTDRSAKFCYPSDIVKAGRFIRTDKLDGDHTYDPRTDTYWTLEAV